MTDDHVPAFAPEPERYVSREELAEINGRVARDDRPHACRWHAVRDVGPAHAPLQAL